MAASTSGIRPTAWNGRLGQFVQREWPLLLGLLALVLFPYIFAAISGTTATTGSGRFWQGLLINFFIMAVYAMSYDLLMGYIGILSFGQAAFFGGGAYTMALFLKHAYPLVKTTYLVTFPGLGDITDGVLLVVAFVLVLLVSALLGLMFSLLSARVKGVYFAMITLAAAEAIHIVSKASDFIQWTGADEGLHGYPIPDFIHPAQNRLLFYFLALALMVLVYLGLNRVVNSPTGRIFQAIRENENRARMIGYNPVIYRSLAFILSSLVAGLAGAWYALWNLSVIPSNTTSALVTINALIMTMLGGAGTLIGPALGAGLMQIIGQFFDQWFGPRWPLVFGLVFIALVLFLPFGIVGTWRMKKANMKEGWQRLVRLIKM